MILSVIGMIIYSFLLLLGIFVGNIILISPLTIDFDIAFSKITLRCCHKKGLKGRHGQTMRLYIYIYIYIYKVNSWKRSRLEWVFKDGSFMWRIEGKLINRQGKSSFN